VGGAATGLLVGIAAGGNGCAVGVILSALSTGAGRTGVGIGTTAVGNAEAGPVAATEAGSGWDAGGAIVAALSTGARDTVDGLGRTGAAGAATGLLGGIDAGSDGGAGRLVAATFSTGTGETGVSIGTAGACGTSAGRASLGFSGVNQPCSQSGIGPDTVSFDAVSPAPRCAGAYNSKPTHKRRSSNHSGIASLGKTPGTGPFDATAATSATQSGMGTAAARNWEKSRAAAAGTTSAGSRAPCQSKSLSKSILRAACSLISVSE
jgi:hypothetical protein